HLFLREVLPRVFLALLFTLVALLLKSNAILNFLTGLLSTSNFAVFFVFATVYSVILLLIAIVARRAKRFVVDRRFSLLANLLQNRLLQVFFLDSVSALSYTLGFLLGVTPLVPSIFSNFPHHIAYAFHVFVIVFLGSFLLLVTLNASQADLP
ncbi:hypothetical protein, partial [Thermus sp. FJN-A]